MPRDAAVQVALVSIITTLITTTGILIVAFLNNRREREGSAEEGIAAILRERITLREERITGLTADKVALTVQLSTALEENGEKTMLIRQLRRELHEAREGRDDSSR